MITGTFEPRDSIIRWLGPVSEWLEGYLNDGGTRLVVKIPTSACDAYDGPVPVLKPPIYRADSRDDRYQNAWEARLREETPDELRPYLTPVLVPGDLYRWR